ncbi:MAG: agmatine deiminase family protein [Acidobacteriota bacterium]
MTNSKNTPAAKGFQMPAEWQRHEATWIGFPHNRTDWPGKITPIYWVYGEITRKLAIDEQVRIIVNDAKHEALARRILEKVGADFSRIEFFRFPSNRGWTRDFGPLFVKRQLNRRAEIAVSKFKFNAWAKYLDYQKDNRIAELAADALNLKIFHAKFNDTDFVLEGGAVDVNGRGTLLTTEECLLDKIAQARNPSLSKAETEAAMKVYLGVSNILWLGKGIEGDDTHGHVDDICRFVNADTVVCVREKNPTDYNYAVMEENFERLKTMRLENGAKLNIVELPMPAPLYFEGRRLPASYANFYISNAAVLVPTFNDENDRRALGILAELFPDRKIIGIHAVDLVWGLGTLHCLTQQQPAK